jgi:hypothetical protein
LSTFHNMRSAGCAKAKPSTDKLEIPPRPFR